MHPRMPTVILVGDYHGRSAQGEGSEMDKLRAILLGQSWRRRTTIR
jgi:hypothetical protein